jgi:hypothetical protein
MEPLRVAGSINPVPEFAGGLVAGVVVEAFLQPTKEKTRTAKKKQ